MCKRGVGNHYWRIVLVCLLLVIFLTSCSSTSGVFAGGKWQSGGLQHQHLLSLAVNPNNPQLIYAGDAQDGIFASSNAGMNWNQKIAGLTLPITIFALVFDDSGKKLYAATDAGVFVSVDATKWMSLSSLPKDSYSSLAFDLNAPNVIYVASEHHGIYMSANDGSSWTIRNNGLSQGIVIHALAFDSVGHQLWAATSQGVYRYNNGGLLWQALNTGLPPNITVNTILPAASSGGEQGLVFAGTTHGFFLTHDNGAHWSQSQVSLVGTSINAIIIDYHTVTTVYVGTGVGVLRSDDNGQNWGGIASGLPSNPTVQALAIGANGYNQLYAATHGIYLFPGNSSAFDPSQIFPVLLVLAFFFALYRFSTRGRRRSQTMLQPERNAGAGHAVVLDFSQNQMTDKTGVDNHISEVAKDERETERYHIEGNEKED
jgi:ligand-binding sensor domain-containing protein